MNAYFVFGPYHLFNAINLKLTDEQNEPAVIYIFNTFQYAKIHYDQLKKTAYKLFQDIYLVDMPRSLKFFCFEKKAEGNKFDTIIRFARRKWNSMHFNPVFYQNIPDCQRVYDKIFIAGVGISFLESYLFYQIKHGCEIHLFDGGLGPITSFNAYPVSFSEKITRLLGLWLHDYITCHHFYHPEYLIGTYNKPIIKQFDLLKLSKEQTQEIQKIYQYQPKQDIFNEFKMVYLKMPSSLQSIASKTEESLMSSLLQWYPNEKIAFKTHPIDANYSSSFQHIISSYPFEITCMFQDIEQIILLASVSTALFTPKLLYDQEPYVIFTYHLLPMDIIEFTGVNTQKMDQIIYKLLIKNYRNPEKIMIPKTIDELKQHTSYAYQQLKQESETMQ